MFGVLVAAVALATAGSPPLSSRPATAAQAEAGIRALRLDEVAAIAHALDEAPRHGLDRGRLVPADLDAALRAGKAGSGAGEGLLLKAAADYAQAVRAGWTPPWAFRAEWARRPEPFDAGGELRQAIAADRLAIWLADLPPPAPAYAALQRALARYEALAAAGGWAAMPAGPTPREGAQDPRAALLRQRLAVEGFVAEGNGDRFDPALIAALTAFQAAHGFEPTGRLDKATTAELNVPVEDRLDQIRANMERRRWAARNPAPTRIEVNIAAQTLDYLEDGRIVLSMRTVVGKAATRTPMFDDVVQAVVFDPPWNVPAGIAAREILPKARADPAYMSKNNFVVLSNGRVQQRPGPDSSLGLVKFDLPNRFDVYLHDTPARALFARYGRAYSHGCIRLERPVDLARRLLADDLEWPSGAIDAALAGGVTLRAKLKVPVPVSIAYWTVFEGADGALQFRRDLYGWDVALTALLAEAAARRL